MVPGEPETLPEGWAGQRYVCLQSTLLVIVGLMSAAAIVLLVFGACSFATRPHPRDTVGLVGTMIGGGLLLLTCAVLLVVVCLWSGRCWLNTAPPAPVPQPPCPTTTTTTAATPAPQRSRRPTEQPTRDGAPGIRLKHAALTSHGAAGAALGHKMPPYAKDMDAREMRYLTPAIYKDRGALVGRYAPLAQMEELTPSLHSSFQSVDDL